MEGLNLQKIYRRYQIPNLRKKTGFMEYLDSNYIDPRSCMLIFVVFMIMIVSIMFVAAIPNTNAL